MAGIGKTALAVHVAHRLADRFPDGQVFLQLHGHTPGQQPVDPLDALGSLLQAFGVPVQFIPDGLEPRTLLWRDRAAGRRMILVLDNASSSGQVAPLLPGDGECLVLVTSRRHLGDLPGAVTPVFLDVLPPSQAAEMFTRLAPRAAGTPSEVAEVARLAGFLPLAISLLARLFARHQSWTLADLADETRASLLTLTAEHESIAAGFEMSYRHLDHASQRFYSLLSLHPGSVIEAYAASALTETGLGETAGLLDSLHGEGLLIETSRRRYGMHDLLRQYARDHADALSAGRSQRAVERLLDYYQHTAARAQDLMTHRGRSGPPPPGSQPTTPVLEDDGQALAWARSERDNLLACLDHATREHQHARITALTAALSELLHRDGPWAEAITRHTIALESALYLADMPCEASTRLQLGIVRRLTSDYQGAAWDLEQALAVYRDLGDQPGQATTLTYLAVVRYLTDDLMGAISLGEQAVAMYRDLGDRRGQASALTYLGTVGRLHAIHELDLARSLTHVLAAALAIYRDLGDQRGQAQILTYLGSVRRGSGDYQGAASDLEQALAMFLDLGDRRGQASSLLHFGIARQMSGDYQGAARDLEQALAIYGGLGDRRGQADSLRELGIARRGSGDYQSAVDDLEEALAIYGGLGDRRGQADSLRELGIARRGSGDYQSAVSDLEEALAIYRDLSNQGGQAETLNEIGTLHWLSDDPAEALAHHRQALELALSQRSGSWEEAQALAGLGRCAVATGDTAQAESLLRQALEILERIGAAEVPGLLAEIATLTGPRTPRAEPTGQS